MKLFDFLNLYINLFTFSSIKSPDKGLKEKILIPLEAGYVDAISILFRNNFLLGSYYQSLKSSILKYFAQSTGISVPNSKSENNIKY